MKKYLYRILVILIALCALSGCSPKKSNLSNTDTAAVTGTEAEIPEEPAVTETTGKVPEAVTPTDENGENPDTNLTGKTLFIYCGAGMTKPFADIAALFEDKTGAKMEVTYGNAAQLTAQIKSSNQGDLFIAGDQGELETIKEEYIADTKSLVKHIPVIAVQKGNPKKISGLSDFAKDGIKVVLGDNQATPIGKIADKALKDAGILENVDVIARTSTAPEIATALSLGQCDAAIVWKENTELESVELLNNTDMEDFIKVVPAASLKCSTNTDALEVFLTFLDSQEAKDIWTKYGYELMN